MSQHWLSSIEHLPLIGAMVTRDDGSIRWPVIVGSLITSGIIGLIVVALDVSAMKARQGMVIDRLQSLELQQAPATMKRFTSDDAAMMEARIERRLRDCEQRLDKQK
jgi:hypothetical protein